MQKADIYDDKSDFLIVLYFMEIYVRQMMIIYIKMFVENHEWHDRSLASLSSFAIFCHASERDPAIRTVQAEPHLHVIISVGVSPVCFLNTLLK